MKTIVIEGGITIEGGIYINVENFELIVDITTENNEQLLAENGDNLVVEY